MTRYERDGEIIVPIHDDYVYWRWQRSSQLLMLVCTSHTNRIAFTVGAGYVSAGIQAAYLEIWGNTLWSYISSDMLLIHREMESPTARNGHPKTKSQISAEKVVSKIVENFMHSKQGDHCGAGL